MTRVYENPSPPAAGEPRVRALLIGAGLYPNAKTTSSKRPTLEDLSSVGPSIRLIASRLMSDWRAGLVAPLETVDMLLSETAAPGGAKWKAMGIQGEIADDASIDSPTFDNVTAALDRCLNEAAAQDHFIFLCCGHGFWKARSYFVLSDFGAIAQNPWSRVIDLDDFRVGLTQTAPRNQWLFFDCCKDIPAKILDTLGTIGDPLIQSTSTEIAKAKQKFGDLSQFGYSSATPGQQAYGIPDEPSRFCEMLADAIDGAGAVQKLDGKWWVNDRGIDDAVRSYPQRNPDLENPDFYVFATPLSNDMPKRMRLRSVAQEPKSRLVALSKPRPALKTARVDVIRDGIAEPVWTRDPAGRAKVVVELPARMSCKVAVTFEGGKRREIGDVFGALPIAEPEQAVFEHDG